MSVPFDAAEVSRVGRRTANEDVAASAYAGEVGCWVLADGLGGHRGGAIAARTAVDAALASFTERPAVSVDALMTHLAQAHEALRARQRDEPALAQMRSTIVLLVADGRRAVWAHAGDSRLYRLRSGRVDARTRDHSVTQALIAAGELAPERQGHHEDRGRLLDVLGKDGEAGGTVASVTDLRAGDAFLLCSDGFWEHLSELDIEVDFAASSDAAGWLTRLECRLARRAGLPADNFTAVAVRLPRPPGAARGLTQQVAPAAVHEAATPMDSHDVRADAVGSARRRRPSILLAGTTAVALTTAAGAAAWHWRARQEPAATAANPGAAPEAQATPVPVASPPASATPDAQGAVSPEPSSLESPERVPEGRAYRVAAAREYPSIADALREAASGETIWLGPGSFPSEPLVIDKPLHIVGAGRDRTKIVLRAGGLRITADDGSLAHVELCCATGDVLEIGGGFAGEVTDVRVTEGGGFGLVLRDRARPRLADVDFVKNKGGNMKALDDARPQ